VIVGREVTAGRFTIAEAKEVLAGRGPMRAPGGITSTTTSVAVTSLSAALDFYGGALGFQQVRSPSRGTAAAVVQAAPGQQIELVEGGAGRPEIMVFEVDDIQRWKDHLTNKGLEVTASGAGLELVDPDGLRVRLEAGL
jgi:catechol 2,3-dioxygenase-like lactoylglutathione lyase family enzyme